MRSHEADVIAHRVAMLPVESRPGWKASPGAGGEQSLQKCQSYKAIAYDLEAQASSETLEFRQTVKVGVKAFVYRSDAAATRAFPEFTSARTERCVASTSRAYLRRDRYKVGSAVLGTPATLKVGAEAKVAKITLPASAGRRHTSLALETTAVRVGRVVGVIGVVARGKVGSAAGGKTPSLANSAMALARALTRQMRAAQRSQ